MFQGPTITRRGSHSKTSGNQDYTNEILDYTKHVALKSWSAGSKTVYRIYQTFRPKEFVDIQNTSSKFQYDKLTDHVVWTYVSVENSSVTKSTTLAISYLKRRLIFWDLKRGIRYTGEKLTGKDTEGSVVVYLKVTAP